MKKILVALSIVFLFSQCNNKNEGKLDTSDIENPSTDGKIDTTKGPRIVFMDPRHDFGDVTEGGTVEHTFKFKNEGNADLIIQNVKPACGCTVPEWTKEAVRPGGEGFVKATFNTDGRSGMNDKSVNVISNSVTKPEYELRFKANVQPKENKK